MLPYHFTTPEVAAAPSRMILRVATSSFEVYIEGTTEWDGNNNEK
jgi:hypothetical protein